MVARHSEAGAVDQRESGADTAETADGGISAATWILFVVGVGLLIAAAISLTHLSEWTTRWGQVPVFLVFFIVMSLAGRWFWGGIDAFIRRIKGE
ncbi:hypothetical protein HH308_24155 [Gordonia sp. TBRC 11910]|uniref:Uncharacterized protein n=1 Tax=Gordonia asplenii TaxID=2725283 RepID=A0A848L1I8_9ACTN|nr:hypothetical protein [Gordonia asplenii]NMO04317.1 hypothetical protein [Gordonia asplenii]